MSRVRIDLYRGSQTCIRGTGGAVRELIDLILESKKD